MSDEQYMGTVIGKCMKNDFQGTYSDEYPMVKLGVGKKGLSWCCLSAHDTPRTLAVAATWCTAFVWHDWVFHLHVLNHSHYAL